MLYGSALAITANIISFGVLAFNSITPGTSIVMGIFHSIYSIAASLVFVILDYLQKQENRVEEEKNSNTMKNLVIFSIAFVIVSMFFGLYRGANSIFKNITDKIDLSFISVQWIGFTILGFFLLYGIYRYRGIKELEKFDLESPDDLTVKGGASYFDNLFSLQTEKKTGMVLFAMLNALLLMVNVIDIIYLYGGAELPEGMNHSGMVHQGVNALIMSIIMAVSIILFFYRGRLNFIKNNKWLRQLTYLWIVQNLFMIFSTAYRNHLYIEEYFLTYKRIGVYVYLMLCVIGLIYTAVKIAKIKTNWFIVRYVGWSFYSVLFVSSIINWDRILIDY
ncbi:MAG: DUF4173 domain-containing protein, partial [Candidatus Lokiarchaeia archaeon]|nr:DUF4173 domain-containing protein [Candidatus Lokiarchaeia archaeon]